MTQIWADTRDDLAIVLLSNGDPFNEQSYDSFKKMVSLLKTYAHSL